MANIVCSGVDSSITSDDVAQCLATEHNKDTAPDLNLCMLNLIAAKDPCAWLRADTSLGAYYKPVSFPDGYLGGRVPEIAEDMRTVLEKIDVARNKADKVAEAIKYNIDMEKELTRELIKLSSGNLLGSGNSFAGLLAQPEIQHKQFNQEDHALISAKVHDLAIILPTQSYDQTVKEIDTQLRYLEDGKLAEGMGLKVINTATNNYHCTKPELQRRYNLHVEVQDHKMFVTSGESLELQDFYCLFEPDSYPVQDITHIKITAPNFVLSGLEMPSTVEQLELVQAKNSNEGNVFENVKVSSLSFSGSTAIFTKKNEFAKELKLDLTNKEDYCSLYVAATGLLLTEKLTISKASNCISLTEAGTINAAKADIQLDNTVMKISAHGKLKSKDKLNIKGTGSSVLVNSGDIDANGVSITGDVSVLNTGNMLSIHSNYSPDIFVNLKGGIVHNTATAEYNTDFLYNLGLIEIGQFLYKGQNGAGHLLYNNGEMLLSVSNIDIGSLVNRAQWSFLSTTSLHANIIDNISANMGLSLGNVAIDTPLFVTEPSYVSIVRIINNVSADFKLSSFTVGERVSSVYNIKNFKIVGSVVDDRSHATFVTNPNVILEHFNTANMLVNGVKMVNSKNAYVHFANKTGGGTLTYKLAGSGSEWAGQMLALSNEQYNALVPAALRAMNDDALRGVDYKALQAILAQADRARSIPRSSFVSVTVDTSIFTNQAYIHEGGFTFRMHYLADHGTDRVKFIEIFEANSHLAKQDYLVVEIKEGTDGTNLNDVAIYYDIPEDVMKFLNDIGYNDKDGNPIYVTGAFFEKVIIQKSLLDGLGIQNISGTSVITKQISALYAHARTLHEIFGSNRLKVGEEVPADMVANVDFSFIWPVLKEMRLPNGDTQKVLFPYLYISKKDMVLSGQGSSVLSLTDSNFTILGDFINFGQIIMSKSQLNIDGNFANLGRLIGSGTFKANNILQLGEISSVEDFKILAENFFSPAIRQRIFMHGGYYDIEVASGAKFTMFAPFEMDITNELILQNINADFMGKTKLKAGKVYMIPLRLDREFSERWDTGGGGLRKKTFHYEHWFDAVYNRGEIRSADNLNISADQITWIAINIDASKGDITLDAFNAMVIKTINDIHLHEYNSRTRGYCGIKYFGGKSSVSKQYNSNPLPMYISTDDGLILLKSGSVDAAGNVINDGSITVEGVEIRAKTVYIDISGHGEFNLLPATAVHYTYEEFSKSGLFQSCSGGTAFVASTTTVKDFHYTETPVPSVIQVEDLFYVKAPNGVFVQAGSKIMSNGAIKISVNEALITTAELIHTHYHSETIKGFAVGATANENEATVGVGIAGRSSTKTISTVQNLQSLLQAKQGIEIACNNDGNLTFLSPVFLTDGTMQVNCSKVNFLTAFDRTEVDLTETTFSVMLKLGFTSSVGALVNGFKSLNSGIEHGGKYAALNTGFSLLSIYNALAAISSGGLINFGLSGSVQYMSMETLMEQETPVPGYFYVGELNVDSETLKIVGQNIKAFNLVFKAHKLDIEASAARYRQQTSSFGVGVGVGLGNNVGGGTAGVNFGSGDAEGVTYFNTKIEVGNKIFMDIKGRATLQGVTIDASSIEAYFDYLLMASLQDTEHYRSHGISLVSGGGGFNHATGDRAAVGEQTRMIARDSEEGLKLIVKHALEINGAILANAEVDEFGNYTDHGNMVVTAASMFVQHVYNHDEGKTLGVMVNFNDIYEAVKSSQPVPEGGYTDQIQKTYYSPKNYAYFNAGDHNKCWTSLSTLGNGEFNVGKTFGEKPNLNLNKTEIETTDEKNNLSASFNGLPSLDALNPLEKIINIAENIPSNIVNAVGQAVDTLVRLVNDPGDTLFPSKELTQPKSDENPAEEPEGEKTVDEQPKEQKAKEEKGAQVEEAVSDEKQLQELLDELEVLDKALTKLDEKNQSLNNAKAKEGGVHDNSKSDEEEIKVIKSLGRLFKLVARGLVEMTEDAGEYGLMRDAMLMGDLNDIKNVEKFITENKARQVKSDHMHGTSGEIIEAADDLLIELGQRTAQVIHYLKNKVTGEEKPYSRKIGSDWYDQLDSVREISNAYKDTSGKIQVVYKVAKNKLSNPEKLKNQAEDMTEPHKENIIEQYSTEKERAFANKMTNIIFYLTGRAVLMKLGPKAAMYAPLLFIHNSEHIVEENE